ncbi:MAG: ATP-binding protein [Proteobacteria bacterium]|nr:ATP-binding protein [Pseudomonadota bacterium]
MSNTKNRHIMDISIQLLQKQNPWWFREELILDDEKLKDLNLERFKYSPKILQQFPAHDDAVLTLRGPRQIGKSTTLKLLVQHLLLEMNIPKRNVFYFSLDRIEDFNQLYDLLDCYLKSIRPINSERLYVLLDEISFVREWQRGIKALAEEGMLKKVTLLLTGSNLIDIGKGAERLPGRRGKLDKVDFEQLPLTFREFVELIEPKIEVDDADGIAFHQNLLLVRFREYLITGGFPLAINVFYSREIISSYVYQLYLNWIEGDICRAGKSERNLYRIMSRILANQSTGVSWLRLSRESGIASHGTVQEYIELLEKMYVLNTIPFIDLSSKEPRYRKNKKVYMKDPLIFHCFSGRNSGIGDNYFSESLQLLNDPIKESKLVESVVGEHLLRHYSNCFYWQGKKEIDFVVLNAQKLEFFEVKYQEQVSMSTFDWFTKIKPMRDRLTVLTKQNSIQTRNVELMPVTSFLLQLV